MRRGPYSLYFDEHRRHKRHRAAWHGLLLVLSVFVWFGLALGGLMIFRALSGL